MCLRNLIPFVCSIIFLVPQSLRAQEKNPSFPWPEGKKMALSLSFDDARASNPTLGVPLLNAYDVKATFFLVPSAVQKDLEGWKKAAASGHEMANHSLTHPCSGNFVWSRNKALENYTLDRMKKELSQASGEIEALLGTAPEVFAYPCGQTFVGKGTYTESYVPLISEMFLAGRGWLDEAPVDPWYADMAQLTGVSMDNKHFEELLPMIKSAGEQGQWLVLAGHETRDSGNQTSYLETIRQICEYAKDPANGVWIAPIGTIARYVQEKRTIMADSLNLPQLVRPGQDGSLVLNARYGRGLGPRITYMPEWNAFGWFMGKDLVEWDVEASQAGSYSVVLEWSVSDQDAGKSFVLTTGSEVLSGKVGKTGSWETFKSERIGDIVLDKGYNKLVFKAAEAFDEGALLDLREIRLIPGK